LAFIAAVSLALDSYNICKAKCLRKAFCKITMPKSRSCCQKKAQNQNLPRKCSGKKTCCFKKVTPIATIDNQGDNLISNDVPVFLANSIAAKTNVISKMANFSTGPPACFNNSTQSLLCIFVI
jgi:hypothetical protein